MTLAPRPQPTCVSWFRLFPVRSPLLGESRLISFPSGTEMFQFPELATRSYEFTTGWQVVPARVAPFGDLRITAC